MKTTRRQAAILFALLLFPAAIFAAGPPDWVTRGVEAVFPADAYIAAEGQGKTRKAAEVDALAKLSLYFEARVETSSFAYERASREDTKTSTGFVAETKNFVQSAVQLFAVRYAAAYHDRAEKSYSTVAYINRKEARRIFEPRLLVMAERFRALWRGAEKETGAFGSYFAYKAAEQYAAREDLTAAILLGEMLYSPRETFDDVKKNLAELGGALQKARLAAQVFIECPKDFESNIQNALAEILGAEGLIVTKNRKAAWVVCAVTVDEGAAGGSDTGYFYYPKIGVAVTDKSGKAFFSWSAALEKQGAMSAEAAKRRTYGALAAELKNNFAAELHKALSAG